MTHLKRKIYATCKTMSILLWIIFMASNVSAELRVDSVSPVLGTAGQDLEVTLIGVAVTGDRAYVADGWSGLLILPLPIEILPVTINSETNISFTIPAPAIAGDYILRVFNANESDETFITFLPQTDETKDRLIKAEDQPEVYWLRNNRLYWITDWDVINRMSGISNWNSVNTLPAGEFNPADYPQGPRFITTGAESDGLLIREHGNISCIADTQPLHPCRAGS